MVSNPLFDVNFDGVASLADGRIVCGKIGQDPCSAGPIHDLNGDGDIDLSDCAHPPISPWWDENEVIPASGLGNPYQFTGRRLDAYLDAPVGTNGVKQIQYNRARYYDVGNGRWLQRDPLGTKPTVSSLSSVKDGPRIASPSQSKKQYGDGMNLYEYVRSKPLRLTDPTGQWKADVHYGRTSRWARDMGMKQLWANFVGTSCNEIDPPVWLWPLVTSQRELSWHFDIPTDSQLRWGPTDSRYVHAERDLKHAISICNRECKASEYALARAVRHLGYALHPVQDWVAHGTWDPTAHSRFNWRTHPRGSDDFGKDYNHPSCARDGILRDTGRSRQVYEPWFSAGSKRATLTQRRTRHYLFRFKYSLHPKCSCRCLLFDH